MSWFQPWRASTRSALRRVATHLIPILTQFWITTPSPIRRRLQELVALQQRAQTEHRQALRAAPERTCQIAVAARDRRRRHRRELRVVEAPEAEHFIAQQTRRHFAVIRHEHA